MSAAARLFVFRPTLGQGGADRVTVTLLAALPRERFAPTLVLMRREGELLDEVPADVPVVALGARRLWTAWWPLARALRRERPDVLFSTSGGANVAAVVAWLLAGRPGRLVLSERNVLRERLSLKHRLLAAAKRLLYPLADRVTAVSEGVRRELVESLRLAPEAVTVVYNPVVTPELERLAGEPLDHPWFADEIPVVLAVGRLVPQKDHATLLRAFARVRARRPARLVLLGEGPLAAQLHALAAELGIAADVWLGGFDKNPFRYMARATVFVLPSRFEGLPGALVQAMACGVAVLATDCPGGAAEVVEAGVDGLLVPVGDAAAMADGLARLLADGELRRRLGERARASAERFAAAPAVAAYAEALRG